MQRRNKNMVIYLTAVFCLFFSVSSFAQADAVKNKSVNTGDP